MTIPDPALRRWHRIVFRWAPTILLAEPFQCFLMIYGAALGITLLNNIFLNPEQAHLYDVLTAPVLVIWAISFFTGSVVMGIGLSRVSKTSAIAAKDRKLELVGLTIIGVAVLLYGIAAPLRLPHEDISQWIQVVVSSVIAFSWFVSIVIRISLITSSVFLLAVSRLTRIRLIKQALRDEDSNDRPT